MSDKCASYSRKECAAIDPASAGQERHTSPPRLIDMFFAGLEANDALHLNREIDRHPEIEPEFWWVLISQPAGSA